VTVIVDTSILIDHLRGDERAHRLLRGSEERGEVLAGSVLTKVEVLAGMRPEERVPTRRLLDALEWLEVDDALAERAGALAFQFLRTHPGVEVVDYVIAATVERLGAQLLTRNRKHFPMFPDLPDPYSTA
jgi:predicted nucleic acid-binding protein